MLVRILCFIALTGFLTGCSDEFLDRNPDDQIQVDNFYRTESDMQSAIQAVYTAMQNNDYYGEAWNLDEVPSDDSRKNFGSQVDNFATTANAEEVLKYWRGHYRAIFLANTVLEKAPDAEITPASREMLMAEARFLRGITYFNLVRIFGGVPLVDEIPRIDRDLLPARASVEETYDFLIADLEAAMAVLPVEHNPGRGTKGGAQSYLAMVHLTLAGNAIGRNNEHLRSARDLALEVINSGVYSLLEDYGDLWTHPSSDNNKESVFEIQFAGCQPWGTGNPRQAFFAPWNQGITKNTDGWGSMIPTDPLSDSPGTTAVDIWEEGDRRRYWSMMEPENYYPVLNPGDGGYTYPINGAGGARANIKKYVIGGGEDVCFMSTPQNGSLMRYSEVILIYAEALTRMSDNLSLNDFAIGLVNQLRERADLEPLPSLTTEAIALERRREFMFEGKRYFDILRLGEEQAVRLLRLSGRTLTADKLLFPLPALELEVNTNLEQNPGY